MQLNAFYLHNGRVCVELNLNKSVNPLWELYLDFNNELLKHTRLDPL